MSLVSLTDKVTVTSATPDEECKTSVEAGHRCSQNTDTKLSMGLQTELIVNADQVGSVGRGVRPACRQPGFNSPELDSSHCTDWTLIWFAWCFRLTSTHGLLLSKLNGLKKPINSLQRRMLNYHAGNHFCACMEPASSFK